MVRSADGPVIADIAPLTPEYLPDRCIGRDRTVEEIAPCLAPARRRRKPIHVWIYGPPGSGKTVAARAAVRQTEKRAPVATSHVSCWRHRSFYSVLDAIITELRVLRAEEQRTAARLRRLEKHLGDGPCVVILDDLDLPSVREREDIVYSLASIGKVGLVCISHSERALLGIQQQVRARLNPQVIGLKAYSAEELVSILEERAMLALKPRSWNKATLSRIAGVSDGSASLAIEVLRAAAYAAEADGQDRISARHVDKARSKSLSARDERIASGLTSHHVALWKLVRTSQRIPSGRLRSAYVARCREANVRPIAPRTYTKYISHLTRAGLIQPVGREGGSRVFMPGGSAPSFHS